MQQKQPGRGAVLHTQTCRAIFIYLYCSHLSLHISWDEANFPSQDKLFLLNSAKSICSQDNFCYCLTQIFWKGKSSPHPPTPTPSCWIIQNIPQVMLRPLNGIFFLPAKLVRCPGAQHPDTGELDHTTFATPPKSTHLLSPPGPAKATHPAQETLQHPCFIFRLPGNKLIGYKWHLE